MQYFYNEPPNHQITKPPGEPTCDSSEQKTRLVPISNRADEQSQNHVAVFDAFVLKRIIKYTIA